MLQSKNKLAYNPFVLDWKKSFLLETNSNNISLQSNNKLAYNPFVSDWKRSFLVETNSKYKRHTMGNRSCFHWVDIAFLFSFCLFFLSFLLFVFSFCVKTLCFPCFKRLYRWTLLPHKHTHNRSLCFWFFLFVLFVIYSSLSTWLLLFCFATFFYVWNERKRKKNLWQLMWMQTSFQYTIDPNWQSETFSDRGACDVLLKWNKLLNKNVFDNLCFWAFKRIRIPLWETKNTYMFFEMRCI